MFLKATRQKLRISTTKGKLSVEDLWDLSLNELAKIVRDLYKKIKEVEGEEELSFLKSSGVRADSSVKLSFEIVSKIYKTLQEEMDAETNAAKNKAHNEVILAELHRREMDEITKLSVEELKARLK